MADGWQILMGAVVGDFLRYFFGAGLVFLVLWKWLRKPLEHRRIAADYPSPRQLRTEFVYSISTVLVFASVGFWTHTRSLCGDFIVYRDVGDYGWTYTAASFVILLLLHDAYFYWTHRLLHSRWLFKQVHAVHHRSRNPSPWAAYSFHPIEALLQAAILPIVLWIMPLHVLVLLAFVIHMILRNAIGHSGFEIYPRNAPRRAPWRWLTSNTHHHLHHERATGNFGLWFSWWDRWMRTEMPEYHARFDEVTRRERVSS